MTQMSGLCLIGFPAEEKKSIITGEFSILGNHTTDKKFERKRNGRQICFTTSIVTGCTARHYVRLPMTSITKKS